jgi:phosphorylcholine metabolism protein LicD
MNCYSYEEKINYFKNINKYYNYEDNVIKIMSQDKKKLCNFNYIKNIKLIEPSFKKKILDLMDKAVNFLDNNDIEYWLDSGTLLGAIRNTKFIPWDDDVDLAIPPKSQIQIHKICEKYESIIYNNKTYFICPTYNIKILIGGSIIKIFNNDDKYLEFIDLICYYKKFNNFCSIMFEYNGEIYNIKDVYPLKKIKFENKYYKSVNNPIPYLNSAYWFWRHIGVASHTHFKLYRNKNIYFIFKNKYNISLHKNIKNIKNNLKKTKKYH